MGVLFIQHSVLVLQTTENMIHLLNISLHDLFCALIKEGEGFEQFKDWNVV